MERKVLPEPVIDDRWRAQGPSGPARSFCVQTSPVCTAVCPGMRLHAVLGSDLT